jgi:hypothetical protein
MKTQKIIFKNGAKPFFVCLILSTGVDMAIL